MPFVRVTLKRRLNSGRHSTIANEIYEAMRETIDIPENDRFIVIEENEYTSIHADQSYLGIERSEAMIMIEITLRRGRSVEKKKALYQSIAQRLSAHTPIRQEDVFIVLHENDPSDWSFGNGQAQYCT